MRLCAALMVLACLAPRLAFALTPTTDDFQGTWTVKRMIGSADVLRSVDYRKPLGTRLLWTATEVTSFDGVCKIVHATVAPVSNDILEHSFWGGQKISDLMLPKTEIASAFGKSETPVYQEGGKYCTQSVMIDRNHIVTPFENGYIYLLERMGR